MNIIYQLFDEKFVTKLFKQRILPRYPDFVAIKKIEIQPHKKYIWEKTYHVVIEFKTTFLARNGKIKNLPIYCTAHSDEPRKNVYSALKFLWDHSFAKGNLTIPHPLFYSNRFRATFYRGVEGKNLYQFIREKNYQEIEKIVIKSARWFAKLHKLPTDKAKNFNKDNSRITTVIPGVKYILNTVKHDYSQYYSAFQQIYQIILEKEKQFFSSTKQRWLIHGDAHPENIIKMSEAKIALIDFTDICLADFTRDLGAFLQQLEFMIQRKIGNKNYIARIKTIFLENYLNNAKIHPTHSNHCDNSAKNVMVKMCGVKLDNSVKQRIENYYNWTALRTATFFLLKDKPEPERAHGLLVKICQDMGLDCHI